MGVSSIEESQVKASSQFKISRDLLYGDIRIPTRYLDCIVDTYQFQLLDWRRQLGTAHLIYRNAHHTRFEHSLGVFELSRRFYTSINSEERNAYFAIRHDTDASKVDSQVQRERIACFHNSNLLFVAALIHDIGNYPFCHQLERSMALEMPNHEQTGSLIVRQAFGQVQFLGDSELSRLGLSDKRDALADVINTRARSSSLSPDEVFVRNVISGPYGLDFLDYIYRDSFYCGFSTRPAVDFLLDHATILFNASNNSYEMGFTYHVLHELVSLAYLRLDMERKVYANKTHKIITEMLAQAVRLAIDDARLNLNEICSFTDDGLLEQLKLSRGHKFVQLIRSRKLYEVVHRFDAIRPDVNPSVRQALRMLGPQQTERLRKKIFEELTDHSIDEDDILLSFPHPEERTCKEGDILILMESGEVRRLNTLDPWIARYEDDYQSLRKYLVLMSKDAFDKNGDKAKKVLQRNFQDWVLETYGVEKLSPQTINDKIRTLSDMQIKILTLLLDKALTAEEIGIRVGKKSRGTVLYHLQRLLEEGFVIKERRGKKVIFTVNSQYASYISENVHAPI